MIHLIKHTKGKLKGKYDHIRIENGNVMDFTNQGFENKSSCIQSIRTILKSIQPALYCKAVIYFQDNTIPKPAVFYVELGNKKVFDATLKPKKFIDKTK